MIKVVRFEPAHLTELTAQQGLEYMQGFFTEDQKKGLAASRNAFTGISDDGRVVVCAGVADLWENRGEAWSVLNPVCKREFLGIHNAVKRFLDVCPIRRIEAAVDIDFEAGHRWARLLKFELETTRARAYLPSGNDAAIYVRVKQWHKQ